MHFETRAAQPAVSRVPVKANGEAQVTHDLRVRY
jgi:hypothetical protein